MKKENALFCLLYVYISAACSGKGQAAFFAFFIFFQIFLFWLHSRVQLSFRGSECL